MLRPGIQCSPLTHQSLGTLPNGTIRISFSHMNSIKEIDIMCSAIESIGLQVYFA